MSLAQLLGIAFFFFVGACIAEFIWKESFLRWSVMIAAAATAFITYAGLWPVVTANASAAFGIGLMGLLVVTFLVVLVFDWIRKIWRLFVLWFDWIWRHPMDNSSGPLLEPEQPRTYTDEELGRAMDATIEAHRAKQRK